MPAHCAENERFLTAFLSPLIGTTASDVLIGTGRGKGFGSRVNFLFTEGGPVNDRDKGARRGHRGVSVGMGYAFYR